MLAMWVVFHHLTGENMPLERWLIASPHAVQEILRNGFLAVNIFFMLSGFVLAVNYRETRWSGASLRRYFVARVARVGPNYVLSLFVIFPFIVEYLLDDGAAWGEKFRMIGYYAFALQGWTGMLPVHWNTPAWSLTCELFFYVCFPLITALIGRRWWPGLIVVAWIALLLPSQLNDWGVPWRIKALYHVADFVLGIALAGLFEKLPRVNGAWLYVPAAVAIAVMIADRSVLGPTLTLATALRPANALLLAGLALGGGVIARWLSTPLMLFLGKASYALYILHVPLLWWFKRTPLYYFGLLPQPVLALIYVVGVVWITGLVCVFFEDPANRWVRSQWRVS